MAKKQTTDPELDGCPVCDAPGDPYAGDNLTKANTKFCRTHGRYRSAGEAISGVADDKFQDFREPGVTSTAVKNEDGTVTVTTAEGEKTISSDEWKQNYEDAEPE